MSFYLNYLYPASSKTFTGGEYDYPKSTSRCPLSSPCLLISNKYNWIWLKGLVSFYYTVKKSHLGV